MNGVAVFITSVGIEGQLSWMWLPNGCYLTRYKTFARCNLIIYPSPNHPNFPKYFPYVVIPLHIDHAGHRPPPTF